MHVDLMRLPPAALAALVVACLVQAALLVVALVVLLKTEESRLTLPRAAWLAVVIVVGFFGPVAFLIGGRRRAPQLEPQAASAKSIADAVDNLYGEGR